MLWAVPGIMALIGVVFILIENSRHIGAPGWPWPTVLGLIVLGLIGPALSWFSLRWAIQTAEAYFHSEELLPEELQILEAIAGGASNKDVAERFFWSDTTVKRRVQEIMEKLGASSRAQAIAEAVRRGWI
ncbi:MAG: response regulator transcription factor [Chloroflexi bacterium]|nr:response regulator transcription factor [Chloroflexota bacterium]